MRTITVADLYRMKKWVKHNFSETILFELNNNVHGEPYIYGRNSEYIIRMTIYPKTGEVTVWDSNYGRFEEAPNMSNVGYYFR